MCWFYSLFESESEGWDTWIELFVLRIDKRESIGKKKYKTRQSPSGSYPQVSAKKLSPISKSAVLIRFLVFLLRNVKDHFMPLVRRLSHAQNHLELLFRPKKVVERKGAVRSLAFCVTRMRTILDFADLATIKIMDIWNDGRCVSFG